MADSDNESGGQNGSNAHAHGSSDFSSPREQDRFLPIANVSRIMKKALPANAKISKDAKEIVQECVSEFISFITGEASDKCQREKRKTINGDDLLWAMTTLGFEDYVDPLKVYLQKFRELEGEKLGGPAQPPQHKEGSEVMMMMMMMGQQMYGSTSTATSTSTSTATSDMYQHHHNHQVAMGGKGSLGGGGNGT